MNSPRVARRREPVIECTVSKLYAHLISNYLASHDKPMDAQYSQTDVRESGKFSYHDRLPLREMDELIQKVSEQLGRQGFGLDVGKHIHPSDFGVIGYALMNCKDLHQSLDFAAKHKHVMNDGFQVELACKGEYCRFQIKNLTDSEHISTLIEIDFAAAMQFSKFLVGSQKQSQVRFIQVNFQHQPLASVGHYEAFFSCPVRFGMDSSEIIISRKVLDIPVRSADPRLLKMYLRKVERMQQSRYEALLTHQQVFTFVSSHLGRPFPCINEVASHFNMSLSLLKKKLQIEGYNYKGICDEVRKNEAIKLVVTRQLSLKEIGVRLGFANPSAFNRAFKRWTGMTPAEYRKSVAPESKQLVTG